MRGEAGAPVDQVEDDDVVSFAALRAVDGAGFEADVGVGRAKSEVVQAVQALPVAAEDEHGGFLLLRDSGDIRQRLGGSGDLVGGGDDDQSVVVAAVRAAQGAPGLFGVALDERAGGSDDRFAVAEGARELAALDEAEIVTAAGHQADVAAGKAVDGLPVVADEEVGDAGSVERLEQGEASGGDILEFVDQDVAERGSPLLETDGFGSVVDQVVEVERIFGAQQLLVALPDALEEVEEGGAAHGIGKLGGAAAQLRHRQPGGFDQTEEGGEQLSEPRGDDTAQFAEQAVDGGPLE